MVEALRFTSYRDNVHSYSEALLDIINAADKPYELSSANRLYGRTGIFEYVLAVSSTQHTHYSKSNDCIVY